MTAHTGERSSGLRRAIVLWSIVAVAFFGAAAGTIAALNSTVYSAPAFVRSYLDALARADGRAALAIPGVTVPESGSRALLNGVALGNLTDIILLRQEPAAEGTVRVTFGYLTDGTPETTEFTVRPTGNLHLFFPSWEFADSPVGTVRVSVQHSAGFTVNGLAVPTDGTTPIGDDGAVSGTGTEYAVLTPSTYTFDHESRYLDADAVGVFVRAPGSVADAVVAPRANSAFVDQAQREVDAYLTQCATQRVLLPSGCPFGRSVQDRIEGEPAWSISRMPTVALQPFRADPNDSTWLVPETTGTANIVVDVKSLFDGRVTTLNEDMPFTVSYRVTILPDGTLSLQGI